MKEYIMPYHYPGEPEKNLLIDAVREACNTGEAQYRCHYGDQTWEKYGSKCTLHCPWVIPFIKGFEACFKIIEEHKK